jgi:hypothetical protein
MAAMFTVFTGLAMGCGSVSSKDPDASPPADAPAADAPPVDAPVDAPPLPDGFTCTPGEVLTCSGDAGTQCAADGMSTEAVTCAAGCNATETRCNKVETSNALNSYLDMAAAEPDAVLGTNATINTDDGGVVVDGAAVAIRSELITTTTPNVRVLIVKSLTTTNVTVRGTPALAIVSAGDIQIDGTFSVSAVAHSETSGPGALDAGGCVGGSYATANSAFGGPAGAGFGTIGGRGGSATNGANPTVNGAAGGSIVGNATLVPLRGGCHSGTDVAGNKGGGGGAVQLVSSTQIIVNGTVAANGSSRGAGGSGGGVLLEAPSVTLAGNVVANGAGGAGGGIASPGEDGRLDAQQAAGGAPADTNYGSGGKGAAGTSGATQGANKSYDGIVFGGDGGGGVGRIRINVRSGGLSQTAVVSPPASVGTLSVR